MVARFSIGDISYSRLLQIPDDDRDFTLEELKPAIVQQNLQQHYQHQPTYYDLSNMIDNQCTSSLSYQGSNSSTMLDVPHGESSMIPSTSRKRKASIHENSDDVEDDTGGEDSKSVRSVKTNDESKKQNHSEIEKRRRDKMNTYITELSSMVPMCHAMSRKLDKLTVLRMAVQHLKTIRGAVHSYTEGHYKPSFLSDQELKHLILQAADGFLFVIGCDRGRILYVSESVSKVLSFSQSDLLGQSLFDILHPKDVAKVKEQLSSSDLNPRERLIDAKTMLPVKTDVPQGASRLCPGARRSFFCRMKCKPSSLVKEEMDLPPGCHGRKKQDKKYNVIHCTGYLKSWAPANIGIEHDDTDDSCNLSCLVAIGRILPHISVIAENMKSGANVQPIQFVSRHAVDGKFLFVDQRATLVLGFLPQELLESSMYEYYHPDEIHSLAECHKIALQGTERIMTNTYRFRNKEGNYVRLQSEWKSFKNPWTKEIDYLIAKNNLILTDYCTVDSGAGPSCAMPDTFDFFRQGSLNDIFIGGGKDMQQIINTHVEASKIGRKIAEQAFDTQRPEQTSIETSPVAQVETCALPIITSPILTNPEVKTFFANPEVQVQMQPECQSQNTFMTYQPQQIYTPVQQNMALTNVTADPVLGGNSDESLMEMMEEAIRESPNTGPSMDGDEAAMAVIMSLLEADAGLGGPVDFSGLPWPLP